MMGFFEGGLAAKQKLKEPVGFGTKFHF